MVAHGSDKAVENVLREFEGTEIGKLTQMNAKNAAIIYNNGPIRRLMGAAGQERALG